MIYIMSSLAVGNTSSDSDSDSSIASGEPMNDYDVLAGLYKNDFKKPGYVSYPNSFNIELIEDIGNAEKGTYTNYKISNAYLRASEHTNRTISFSPTGDSKFINVDGKKEDTKQEFSEFPDWQVERGGTVNITTNGWELEEATWGPWELKTNNKGDKYLVRRDNNGNIETETYENRYKVGWVPGRGEGDDYDSDEARHAKWKEGGRRKRYKRKKTKKRKKRKRKKTRRKKRRTRKRKKRRKKSKSKRTRKR
jgi:hypothetical protein